MYNAPEIYLNIPDLKQIYDKNEEQKIEMDLALQEMDDDIFLETMHENKISRWEKMLVITPLDDDTLEDRRFRIQAKVLERLPYSYRVLYNKLDALCNGNFVMTIDNNRLHIEVEVNVKAFRMVGEVKEMLDNIIPLNMTIAVTVRFNTYKVLSDFRHSKLANYTQLDLREGVIE